LFALRPTVCAAASPSTTRAKARAIRCKFPSRWGNTFRSLHEMPQPAVSGFPRTRANPRPGSASRPASACLHYSFGRGGGRHYRSSFSCWLLATFGATRSNRGGGSPQSKRTFAWTAGRRGGAHSGRRRPELR
jgi:hypothetical protein